MKGILLLLETMQVEYLLGFERYSAFLLLACLESVLFSGEVNFSWFVDRELSMFVLFKSWIQPVVKIRLYAARDSGNTIYKT